MSDKLRYGPFVTEVKRVGFLRRPFRDIAMRYFVGGEWGGRFFATRREAEKHCAWMRTQAAGR